MADLDPYTQNIPKAFLDNPETREWVFYLNRWLHDAWEKMGGGDDAIEESKIGELYEPGIQTSNADELIDELEVSAEMQGSGIDFDVLGVFEVISITADYTTTGNEIIICSNSSLITVTMNATPGEGERSYIKRTNGPVNVTSSKGIDGKTTKRIKIRYDCPLLVYTTTIDEYSII